MLNHRKFTNLKQNLIIIQWTAGNPVRIDPCLSWKATKLGQSFGLDRKKQGLVSPHSWHDKDSPSPRTDGAKLTPTFQAMATSPYEWNMLDWNNRQTTDKHPKTTEHNSGLVRYRINSSWHYTNPEHANKPFQL